MVNRIKRENNKRPQVERIFRFVVSMVLIGLSAMLFVNSARSIITAYNRSLLLQQAYEEVSELRLENLSLLEEEEKMLGESYVEGEARDRLSYVKKGEIIVVLPETGEKLVLGEDAVPITPQSGVPGRASTLQSSEGDTNEVKGWLRWWNILKDGV